MRPIALPSFFWFSESHEQQGGTELSLVQGSQSLTFCEINSAKSSKEEDILESASESGFHAEMAIQAGGYNILIGSNVSEKALSTVS